MISAFRRIVEVRRVFHTTKSDSIQTTRRRMTNRPHTFLTYYIPTRTFTYYNTMLKYDSYKRIRI